MKRVEHSTSVAIASPWNEEIPGVVDAEVQSELDRILISQFFKSSTRCCDFLKHIVTFSESPGSLKERTIGISVFGRAPDYDTGTDAIVRVKANEVRKRLAQYNQSADPLRSVTIELSPGSYAPRIIRRANQASVFPLSPAAAFDPGAQAAQQPKIEQDSLVNGSTATPVNTSIHTFRWIAWSLFAATLLIVIAYTVHSSIAAASPVNRLLRPFLGAAEPIICLSHPRAYTLPPQERPRKGDVPAAFRLQDKLHELGRSSRISIANDVTSADLATAPMIVIGGPRFNQWTANLTQNLRFAFQVVDNKPRVTDSENPKRFWEDPDLNPRATDDYVIITRLLNSTTTRPVICIAGIKAFGSRAGTELILSPAMLKQILKYAPDNWDQKSFQLVLHVTKKEKELDIPRLVAATYW
jgi:hypothetical protein